MPTLSRADNSMLGRWWWTVDRWTLGAIGTLIGFGYIMMLAASPAVAERIGQSRDLFILKQVFFLAVAGVIVVAVSHAVAAQHPPPGDHRLHHRADPDRGHWSSASRSRARGAGSRLPGLSVQPSEFLKPCFAIVAAWLISEGRRTPRFPGKLLAIGIFAVIALLLKSQPDVGMLAVITAVFFVQLYVDGLNLFLAGIAMVGFGFAGVAAYTFFPHVQKRVQEFLHPGNGMGGDYQPHTALEAFGNGGLLGRGPGEGRVKDVLPDAHADFVFAVAGEEFGMIVCLIIIARVRVHRAARPAASAEGAGPVHRAVLHRPGHRLRTCRRSSTWRRRCS